MSSEDNRGLARHLEVIPGVMRARVTEDDIFIYADEPIAWPFIAKLVAGKSCMVAVARESPTREPDNFVAENAFHEWHDENGILLYEDASLYLQMTLGLSAQPRTNVLTDSGFGIVLHTKDDYAIYVKARDKLDPIYNPVLSTRL